MSSNRFPQFKKIVEGCTYGVTNVLHLPFELRSNEVVFAILIEVGDQYLLVPTNVENVVLLNGESTDAVALFDGDTIQFEMDEFIFELGNEGVAPQISPIGSELVGETTLLVNHRINNFFQVISGGGYLLDTGIAKKDLELVIRGWNTIKAKQEQLAELLSKVVSLKSPPVLSIKCDELNDMLRLSLENWSRKAENQGFRIEFEKGDPKVNLSFDRQHLSEAIDGLLNLAVKASFPENRLIRIQLNLVKRFVHLGIGNHGTGISIQPENSQNIRRQANETSGGVDFNFSRSLIRAHGGELLMTQAGAEKWRINVYLPLNAAK